VLEHVLEPAEFLRQARLLLQPGGVCFVLVPNIESLATRFLGGKYRYVLPQHLNYFSIQTLRRLATQEGFSVVQATTMHFNPVVLWQDFRNKSRFVTDRDRANLLVKTNEMKRSAVLLPVRGLYAFVEKLLGKMALADNVVLVLRK
jgi:2-polyprenyl-3-methyl-5-hydroxy-6-metoxy-1,4-benzoquinol methylase